MGKGFALFLFLFLYGTKVLAYTFTADIYKGAYWHSFPIAMGKYVVDSSDGPLLESVLEDTVAEWESSLGYDIWAVESSVIVGSNYSGNHIRWSNNFAAETGFDPNQTLAVTIRYSDYTTMIRTEIILNGGLSYLRNNSGGILRTTILHELGHTIGLDHSKEHAIMAPYVGETTSLQPDDIQGGRIIVEEHYNRQGGHPGIQPVRRASDYETVQKNAMSCGTVDLQDRNGGNGGASSLLVGFLTVFILYRRRAKMSPSIAKF